MDDFLDHNRKAWDRHDEQQTTYSKPVTAEVIADARRGAWAIYLTDIKPAPREWFPVLTGCRVLCLAGSGGQQAPVLAAAGAASLT